MFFVLHHTFSALFRNERIEVRLVKRREYNEETAQWADAVISAGGIHFCGERCRGFKRMVISVMKHYEEFDCFMLCRVVSAFFWIKLLKVIWGKIK